MSAKRDTAAFVRDWIAREKARAESCRAQAADLERQAVNSDRRAAALQEMHDLSGFANAPTADEDAGF